MNMKKLTCPFLNCCCCCCWWWKRATCCWAVIWLFR